MQRIEFTIEPFEEGRPGRHVTAPADAVRSMGIDVEVGPFGTSCSVDDHRAGEVVSAIVSAALEHGASHVNVDVTDSEPGQ